MSLFMRWSGLQRVNPILRWVCIWVVMACAMCPGLLLVESDHVTSILASDWSIIWPCVLVSIVTTPSVVQSILSTEPGADISYKRGRWYQLQCLGNSGREWRVSWLPRLRQSQDLKLQFVQDCGSRGQEDEEAQDKLVHQEERHHKEFISD